MPDFFIVHFKKNGDILVIGVSLQQQKNSQGDLI